MWEDAHRSSRPLFFPTTAPPTITKTAGSWPHDGLQKAECSPLLYGVVTHIDPSRPNSQEPKADIHSPVRSTSRRILDMHDSRFRAALVKVSRFTATAPAWRRVENIRMVCYMPATLHRVVPFLARARRIQGLASLLGPITVIICVSTTGGVITGNHTYIPGQEGGVLGDVVSYGRVSKGDELRLEWHVKYVIRSTSSNEVKVQNIERKNPKHSIRKKNRGINCATL